jgi:outer membrane receptor protein involved in Fe transport
MIPMTISRTRLLAAASAFAVAFGAQSAWAQEATAIDEIVVTAQKQQQQAIDVPISLTAYGSERLAELGIQDFADLSLFTPGFEVQDQSPNNPGFVMRGITSDSTASFAEPRVSVFQDGVSISKAQGSYVELFDLERVEVAKGPQSTLFGRGALIGGVNIIQKKASAAEGISGYLKGEVGDFDARTFEGAVNLPLGEVAALRLSVRDRSRDGYVKNALGGGDFQSVDTTAFRAAFNYAPNERFNADVLLNYQSDTPNGTSFKANGYSPTNPVTGQVLGSRDPGAPAALVAGPNFMGGMGLGLDRVVRGVSGLMSYELSDGLTLHAISAYRRYDSQEVFDPDGISLPALTGLPEGRGEQWSQELRLNYDTGGRLRGFVGGGFFKAEDQQRSTLQFDERISLAALTGQLNAGAAGSGLPATTPAPAAIFANTAFTGALVQGLVGQVSGGRIPLPTAQARAIAANLRSNHVEEAGSTSDLEAIDLFADVTYDLTDRLEVSGGLRYTRDERETGYGSRVIGGRSVLGGVVGAAQLAGSGTPLGLAQAQAILGALALPIVQQIPAPGLPRFGLTFQPTPGNAGMTVQGLEDEALTWRLVGRYALSDDANLYASYARGRKPELLSALPPSLPEGPAQFVTVKAETVDSYEVGAKAALLDRRLRVDASTYYYSYENFQTVEQRGTQFIISNAGKATAYGVEGQLEWAVAQGLEFFATYAYSHARFDEGAYEGNRFRLSPDHSASVGASWIFPALAGLVEVRPSYTWQSKVYFDDANDRPEFQQPPVNFVADNLRDEVQPSYGLLNLRLAWTADSAPVTLEAFGTNLLDEDYIIDAGNTGDAFGLPTFIAGPPRMVGVGATYRFR